MRTFGKHIDSIGEKDTKICTDCKVLIENCMIDSIDIFDTQFKQHVTVKNCIIGQLSVLESAFNSGLTFTNNIVMSKIQYHTSYENDGLFEIYENIFMQFVDFFDCQFNGSINVSNNIFRNNCSLLFREKADWDPIFKFPPIIEKNIRRLDVVRTNDDRWLDSIEKLKLR